MKLLTIILLFLTTLTCSFAQELVLDGFYKGQNLYIQNPKDGDGNYCIREIYINGIKIDQVPQSTAFDIKLNHLVEKSPVNIRIVHGVGCKPKAINPNAINRDEQFRFTFLKMEDQKLNWGARGEKTFGKYFVMKYENNGWVTEKVLECHGKDGIHNYTYDPRFHSGSNKFKIRYLDISGKIYFSNEVAYFSNVEEVSFYPKRVSSQITFSRPVKFAILDVYGKVLTQERGESADCSELKSGIYYVSYDNKTEKFFKK